MSGSLSNEFVQAAQKAGSLEKLCDEFFHFLYHRTDFYIQFPQPLQNNTIKYSMGFPEGEAEKMILKSLHKFSFKDYDKVMMEMSQSQPDVASNTSKPTSSSTSSPPASASTLSSSSSSTSKNATSSPTSSSIRYNESGKQLPLGNGGIDPVHGYSWTQSLQEVSIHVPLFELENVKGKEVETIMNSQAIKIKIRGKPLLEGNLSNKIKVNESMWSLSSSSSQSSSSPYLILSLWKEKEIWWSNVFEGHVEIDTTKVDSTKNIEEYDEQTQGMIRKLVHEERENRLKNGTQRPDYYE